MAQEKKTKATGSQKTEEVTEVEAKDVVNEELDADVEDVLADIDDILETNAEEFVSQYIQKGGQ